MTFVSMVHTASFQPACIRAKGITNHRRPRRACQHVCSASQMQVAKPAKLTAGVTGALLSAAAVLQVFSVPAADAIATQTDMFARPQMSENKGQKTGQPSQQKPGNEPGGGAALASSGAAEKGGMPSDDSAEENSRMQRSTSGSMSAAGPGRKASK
ncbi:hypothetical protein ABBQ38_013618 [Trebouxia sp. C0009 RCD-2024]